MLLTHYYHQDDRPFQSLSALPDRAALTVIAVSYWLQSQSDKDYYQPEYRGRVFSIIDEIMEIIDRFGIPDREWQDRPDRKYDLFIEAQVWSDDSRSERLRQRQQHIIEPSTDPQLAQI